MSGAAAKTVSFSPLRAKQASVKISLDAPYQLKWPHIAPDKAESLFEELKRSLSGMKELLSVKFQTTTSASGKKKRRRKRKGKRDQSEESGENSEASVGEPVAKKVCLETSEDASSAKIEESQTQSAESALITDQLQSSRKSQLVIGTNAFTRSLEEGSMRVGVVCLTAKPALIHKHILQLSATRSVPVAALSNLSPTIAPLLGMKSSLAIGVKNVAEGEVDGYSDLVDMVTRLAPPISIPWLTSDLTVNNCNKTSYIPLNVKKTISRQKTNPVREKSDLK